MPPSSTTLCIYVDRCIPSLQTPDAWSVSIGTCAYVHTGDDDGMGREENEWTRDRLAVGILGQSGGGSPFGIRGPSRRGFWRTQPNTVLHDMCWGETESEMVGEREREEWKDGMDDENQDQVGQQSVLRFHHTQAHQANTIIDHNSTQTGTMVEARVR